MIINNEELSNLILEIDNNINNTLYLIKDTNNLLTNINDDTWKSPEKNKFDDDISQVINNINNNIDNYLLEPINLLKNINITYQDIEKDLNKKVDELD